MTTTSNFIGVSTVAIPVTDQAASKAFYESLGFETRLDAELAPGFRWVEVAPPGATTTIALVVTGDGLPTGVDTGIRLVVGDAAAAHIELTDAGLTAGELLDWPGVPLMFSFADHDGNRLYVTQQG